MTIKGKAYIAGVFEHPTRKADDKSLAQLHAESAMGALADAGLTKNDVDGYFCAGDAPGLGPLSMAGPAPRAWPPAPCRARPPRPRRMRRSSTRSAPPS